MDEFGQRLHGIIGPYNEGYPMTLVCEGEGGDPPPNVTWWKDSVLVDGSYTLTPQRFVRNELHFPSISREDLLTVLSCQAANSNLSLPATSSVVLDLNLRPLDVKIHTPHRPLRVGEEVQLVCQSQGARPPAQITWWKKSEKLVQATETMFRENNLTISVLTYVPSVDDNGVNISCHADNPQVRNSQIYDHWYLDVYYPPQVSLSNNAEIPVEGSNITLCCHVTANPVETTVKWTFNGETLSSWSSGTIMKNQSLVLSPVRKSHQGFYQCEAINSEGSGKSQELFLMVYYAPECVSPNEIIYGILRSKPSTVICEVDANPTDVTFKWALNRSSQEILPFDSFKSNGTRSVATIFPGTDLNYGTLLCWATNSVALQKDPCVFHLLPAGPPEPPTRCVTTESLTDCLMVQCLAGNDGGLTQYFHLEMSTTESGRLQTNLSVSDVPAFNICSLPAETSYTLLIYSANAKGRSKSVALRSNVLSSRNIREEETQLINHVAGILIGIAIVMMILCVAIIVGKFRSCTRTNDRKFRQEMEKSPAHILINEGEETRISRCQGPDIIPENKYFQKKTTMDSICYPIVDQKGVRHESSPKKYSRYKSIKYSSDSEMVLSDCLQSPRKLHTLSETEGEVEDSNITVETPLINDIQLTVAHWGETQKEKGILSTPV